MNIFESRGKWWQKGQHGIPEDRPFGAEQNIIHLYSFLTKSECLRNESNLHKQSA